jgi:hypothetical protein
MTLQTFDPDVLAEDCIKTEDLGDCFRVVLKLGDNQSFPLRTCPKARMAIVLRIKRALAQAVRLSGQHGDDAVLHQLRTLAAPYFRERKARRNDLASVDNLMKLERATALDMLHTLEAISKMRIISRTAPHPDDHPQSSAA